MDLQPFAPGTRPYLDLDFPAPPLERPYVIVNMVGSIDGKAALDGTEQGLGSLEDYRRMQELRARADAVLNGAGTLRQSGATARIDEPDLVAWRRAHGKGSDFPLGLLLTHGGDFPLTGDYFDGSGLAAVVFGTAIPAARAAEIEARGPVVVPIADGPPGLRQALAYLRQERGVTLLLCEGGPGTNAELLAAGCVDEWFQTLSPTLVGGHDTLTTLTGPSAYGRADVPRCELRSALANAATSELYLRYRITGHGGLRR
jgi:riboflavin biosynthesis pyrimidine reductase